MSTQQHPSPPPNAIFFDVFGTCVDWRSSIHRALTQRTEHALNDSQRSLSAALRQRASALTSQDWHVFTQEWRNSYKKFTRTYDPAAHGGQFVSVDKHHLEALRELLQKWELDGLFTDEEIHTLSLDWHYLDPWPDTVGGLTRLNTKFETSTFSNGNVSLLQDLCKNGPLPFKHITSAEEFGAYKPSPAVYDGAARKLGFEPKHCVLVAAHLGDLKAAKGRGFQTVYVERPQEEDFTDEQVAQAKLDGWVDVWVGLNEDGFREVATRFGV
jgi:2-haloacid dehalogenase